MPRPAMETYKHYKVVTHADGHVAVYDPRYPRNPSLHDTDTVAKARRWVSAYRDGVTWAAQECNQ